jgi:hypothetical protein
MERVCSSPSSTRTAEASDQPSPSVAARLPNRPAPAISPWLKRPTSRVGTCASRKRSRWWSAAGAGGRRDASALRAGSPAGLGAEVADAHRAAGAALGRIGAEAAVLLEAEAAREQLRRRGRDAHQVEVARIRQVQEGVAHHHVLRWRVDREHAEVADRPRPLSLGIQLRRVAAGAEQRAGDGKRGQGRATHSSALRRKGCSVACRDTKAGRDPPKSARWPRRVSGSPAPRAAGGGRGIAVPR